MTNTVERITKKLIKATREKLGIDERDYIKRKWRPWILENIDDLKQFTYEEYNNDGYYDYENIRKWNDQEIIETIIDDIQIKLEYMDDDKLKKWFYDRIAIIKKR